MLNNSTHYTSRVRTYNKPPVYTSDKRAKFTQRENKKWIRLATVVGYIVFVSLPAVILSIYYIYGWNPRYLDKLHNNNNNSNSPLAGHTRIQGIKVYMNNPDDPNNPVSNFMTPKKRDGRSVSSEKQCQCACSAEKHKEQTVSADLGSILEQSFRANTRNFGW